jgi:superfamily II DNA or RNA helicase
VNLRPYQASTVNALLSPGPGINRSLCVMATGGGKTIVFASFLDQLLKAGERALILAHREELLTQARDKLSHAAPTLHVEIEQAQKRASKYINGWTKNLRQIDRSVVVASIQTLRGKRLQSWKPDTFSCIVVDEAHHSTAGSYIDILKHFGCFDPERRTRLVGVTATPGRTDGVGLGAVYQEIAAEWGIRELIKLGWLCPLTARRVTSEISLANVKASHGDFVQSDLERTIDVSSRNELIVGAYEEHAAGERTIVFAAGVDHAHHIADLFRARGHNAETVWGDMDKDRRGKVLADFQSGAIPILTNYGVLTEGFDAPKTSCIILARPTKSSLVVAQCIGRGTRIAEGKARCLVLDVRDSIAGKNLATAASLAGLPPNFDPKGESLMEMGEEFEALDPRLKPDAIDADQLADVVSKVKKGMSVAEIDLFAAIRVDPEIRSRSSLAWMQTGECAWAINADKIRYGVHVDTLGRYVLTRDGKTTAVEEDPKTAFAYADAWVRSQHENAVKLLDLSQRWRKEPATDPQKRKLAKLTRGKEMPQTLNKGDAALLIDSLTR